MNIRFLVSLYLILFHISCEKNTRNNSENPCMLDKQINTSFNLNFPAYANLQFAGNELIIHDDINFIEGVYLKNNGGSFLALELDEPNDCLNTCDFISFSEGFFHYHCEDKETKYTILGTKVDLKESEFNMRIYNVQRVGDVLYVRY